MAASLKTEPASPVDVATAPLAIEACCPRCGGQVRRIPRLASDRAISLVHSVGRYRCRDHGCSWQGLLSLSNPAMNVQSGLRRAALLLFLLLSIAAVAVFAGIRQFVPLLFGVRPDSIAAAIAGPGWSTTTTAAAPGSAGDGARSVPGERNRLPETPLGIPLRDCNWAGGGRLPYVGTFTEALVAAGLPADAVAKLVRMHDRGVVTDRLEISVAGVRSSSGNRHFESTARAMSLGAHICMEVRLTPAAGTVETADLLEVNDGADRRHLVMVTTSGGNVAIMEELPVR